jgi:hypothetical protein
MALLRRWIPWEFLIRRAAKAHGIIDPLNILARVRQFSQPSEVQEPIELLRAGIIFHARGLINTKAIQHNLDWVWPYWVERQFNPNCTSFIPRAFSFSHVNLTHRNWTAVGHPDLPLYPIVDPRGLVTPLYDGWSLDFWILTETGEHLFPSRLETVDQQWAWNPNPVVITRMRRDHMRLETRVDMVIRDGVPTVRVRAEGRAMATAWLVAAVRPYNPEGIQFIERIEAEASGMRLRINRSDWIAIGNEPDRILVSTYADGDVLNHIGRATRATHAACRVGMATAAMLFAIESGRSGPVELRVPIGMGQRKKSPLRPIATAWESTLTEACQLRIPEARYQFLYDAALRTMTLLTADDVFPGPYTYRRFWFRDACLMLNALLGVNLIERSRRILNTFPARRKWNGYFQSQAGEWDSNGQVLWIMDRFQRMTGQVPDAAWLKAIRSGADWIVKKRLPASDLRHAGLLPPGFSAEHLGPNDYYYWDDFWGLAGLRAAARLLGAFGDRKQAQRFAREADDFEKAIDASIASDGTLRREGIPAAPYRRMDAGAVGSLVADYPLCLTPPGDPRIMATVTFLMKCCFHKGAFFQDMIHSGLNAYLTLDIAQTLLRAGDPRWRPLVDRVAELASSTGQWPEAVHPATGGGCMGDGQHGWAAAEWLMMMRSLFLREETDQLIIGSGIAPQWLTGGNEPLVFGPTPTAAGTLTVQITPLDGRIQIHLLRVRTLDGAGMVRLTTAIPGYRQKIVTSDALSEPITLELDKT